MTTAAVVRPCPGNPPQTLTVQYEGVTELDGATRSLPTSTDEQAPTFVPYDLSGIYLIPQDGPLGLVDPSLGASGSMGDRWIRWLELVTSSPQQITVRTVDAQDPSLVLTVVEPEQLVSTVLFRPNAFRCPQGALIQFVGTAGIPVRVRMRIALDQDVTSPVTPNPTDILLTIEHEGVVVGKQPALNFIGGAVKDVTNEPAEARVTVDIQALLTGEYDVTSFGAVGDGTTDDTVAIQEALTAAASSGGGVVYMPRGDFRVTGTLQIGDDTTLAGFGPEVTTISSNIAAPILQAPSTVYDPLDAGRTFRVFVKDLGIDNTDRTTAGAVAIDFSQVSLGGISGVRVRNVELGVRVANVARNNVLQDLDIDDVTDGIEVLNGADYASVRTSRINAVDTGVRVSGGVDAAVVSPQIDANTVITGFATAGVSLEAVGANGVVDPEVRATIESVTGTGVVVAAAIDGAQVFSRIDAPTQVTNASPNLSQRNPSISERYVEWDLDWSAEPSSGILATGPISLFGETWQFTVDTGAPNTQVEVIPGSGVRVSNLAAGVLAFTSASQQAAYFALPLSTLYARLGIDSRWDIAVDGYMSAQTGNVWVQGVQWGFYGPSSSPQPARMNCVRFWGATGNNQWSSVFGSAQSNQITAAVTNTLDVARVQWSGGSWSAYAGAWGGSFDATPLDYAMGDAAATSEESPLTINNGLFVVAFPVVTSSASGVGDVIMTERMRIRARNLGL